MANRCKSEADRNQVFAGAYVSYLAFFETQLEDLFIGLTTGKYTHPNPAVRPTVLLPSSAVAKAVITGGRSYVDWLPYDRHTAKRAPAFLIAGEPFASLSRPRRNALEKSSVLRNALAHYSEYSLKRFTKEFLDGRTLPVAQRKPAGYLRGAHSLHNNRLEVQLMELVATMRDLTT